MLHSVKASLLMQDSIVLEKELLGPRRLLCQLSDRELSEALYTFIFGVLKLAQGSTALYNIYEALEGPLRRERDKTRQACRWCKKRKCPYRQKNDHPPKPPAEGNNVVDLEAKLPQIGSKRK